MNKLAIGKSILKNVKKIFLSTNIFQIFKLL
jgi:hypothetical protein